VAASRQRLEAAVARRSLPITGVSEFANASESVPAMAEATAARGGVVVPVPAFRLAEGYERLRARADALDQRPRVFLCTLGRSDEFAARAAFASNLFAAGGIATVGGEALASLEQLDPAFRASGASQAAICSSDANYAISAEAAARTLKKADAARVYLIGRPEETQGRVWRAAGVDEFVHGGCDVLATLGRALAAAGAAV
jgi:methylmalonyl-CoA mutase